MSIRTILNQKGDSVVTVKPETRIRQAMHTLVKYNIGALLVYDDQIQGIITERDLLRAAAEDPARLSTSTVADLMTRSVITADPNDDIQHVMKLMTERRIRHLPIVEKDTLVGIISIGDVVNSLRHSAETENRQLYAYIAGTPL